MRIVVVGPGALGCFFAGMLSKKAEVWLLDKDRQHAKKILKNDGIFCEGVSGKSTPNNSRVKYAIDCIIDLV